MAAANSVRSVANLSAADILYSGGGEREEGGHVFYGFTVYLQPES